MSEQIMIGLYSAVTALIAALALGPLVIPVLSRLKFGQSIREEGPKSHQAKAGTPTLGGIIILVAMTIPMLIFFPTSGLIWLALFITLGHGLLGFLDDFIKIVLKRNLGLKARQKLLGQTIMAVGLAYVATTYFGRGTDIWIPLVNKFLDFGPFYYIIVFFVLIGTTNAVNLTDGLDGLAAGTTVIAATTYGVICYYFNQLELMAFSLAVAGACLGFLKYNIHTARVFMGDTGSLALGGALAIVAVMTRTELLLVIVGGVYVVETLSVMIQVISFKTTGKRVFKMSPIHHHFELSGWSEQKVVVVFWSAGLLFSMAALVLLAAK